MVGAGLPTREQPVRVNESIANAASFLNITLIMWQILPESRSQRYYLYLAKFLEIRDIVGGDCVHAVTNGGRDQVGVKNQIGRQAIFPN